MSNKSKNPVSRQKTQFFYRETGFYDWKTQFFNFMVEKPGGFFCKKTWPLTRKNSVFQQKTRVFWLKNWVYCRKPGFSIEKNELPSLSTKLGFSLINRVSHWKTRFLDYKTEFFNQEIRFLDREMCFLVKNPVSRSKNWVFRWETWFFDQETGFFYWACNRAFWSKNPVFHMWLINLVFRLARNPVFWTKNCCFSIKKPGFSINWTLSLPKAGAKYISVPHTRIETA